MRAAVTNDQLLEVLGALSLTTDLANGNPMGSALRSCAIAIEVSRELGIGAEEMWAACYAALLRHIGCTSYAHEEASAFGDELEFRRLYAPIDSTDRGALFRLRRRPVAIAGIVQRSG